MTTEASPSYSEITEMLYETIEEVEADDFAEPFEVADLLAERLGATVLIARGLPFGGYDATLRLPGGRKITVTW